MKSNTKSKVIRWLLFLTIGIVSHWIFLFLYLIVYVLSKPFFRFKNQLVNYDHIENKNPYFSPEHIMVNNDDHGLLTHYTVFSLSNLKSFVAKIDKEYVITRKPAYDKKTFPKEAFDEISGDCVISFCFALSFFSDEDLQQQKELILNAAKTYLVNLGVPSWDEKNTGTVSSRCNNFGINWCPDGWGQLGQPAFGPQYFTSAALFALASRISFKWKIIYHLHRLIMGGWFFELAPLVVPKNSLFYVRDMTVKAIYTLEKTFGLKWWMEKAYKEISYTTEYKNPVLCAFAKRLDYNYYSIPKNVHRFFGQNKTGTSEYDERAVIPNARDFLIKLSMRK